MKYHYLIYFLILLSACSESPGGSIVEDDDDPVAVEFPGTEGINYLFEQGIGGYACYRIPALLRVDDQTLLAFAEGRKNSCSDTGNIDLVVRRSEDNGFTWGETIVVWDDAENTCGNPAPIWDAVAQKVVLLATWNDGRDDIGPINDGTSIDTRRVYHLSSTDKGESWSSATEITEDVKLPNWRWYATGPGSGIQIKNGPYADRLMVGCDYIDSERQGYSHVIYSDDHGENWVLGGVSPEMRTNECEVAELSNGDLMLNMRNSGNEKRRKLAKSSDGGDTWEYLGLDNTLISPKVQSSLHRFSFEDNILLFSNPADQLERMNMTIRLSTDDGSTWPSSFLLHRGFAAYSDLENYNEDRVAILYETGPTPQDRYQGISFETVGIDEIQ